MAAAILAAAGGLHLAWKPIETRLPSDRLVLRSFTGELQTELDRLEDVLEADLQELVEIRRAGQEFALKEAVGRLFGAAEVTGLQDGISLRPSRVRSAIFSNPLPPEVGWKRSGQSGPGAMEMAPLLGYDSALRPGDRPAELKPAQGWIRSADGIWAFYWHRQPMEKNRADAVVVTLHAPTMVEVMNRHLQDWAREHFRPVEALKGVNFLDGPAGVQLAGSGEKPRGVGADFVAPLSNHWGQWQLVSWDRLETKPGWDTAVLTVTALVSGVLAITAVMVFVQLRRALRKTEERVTFVNRVSHDLGTPLTNMMLNLDLAKEAVEMDPQDCTERLETVAEEGQRLARLIENVLAFSRSGRAPGPTKLTRCVPKEVVERVVKQFEPALRRKHISTSVELSMQEAVLMDPDALAQILANLISNAQASHRPSRFFGKER